MDHSDGVYVDLLRTAAKRMAGHPRRPFEAERRFGWGRATVAKGRHERRTGVRCLANVRGHGRRRAEDVDPKLAEDVRAFVEPRCHADPAAESSDFWVDALLAWRARVGPTLPAIRTLVVDPDDGPNHSGRRRRLLGRVVGFADATSLAVRLVYCPPYHGKYNPVERCWSALQRKGDGALLNGWAVVRDCARRMTWRRMHPTVDRLAGDDPSGGRVPEREMRPHEARPARSATPPTHDITIRPLEPRQAG